MSNPWRFQVHLQPMNFQSNMDYLKGVILSVAFLFSFGALAAIDSTSVDSTLDVEIQDEYAGITLSNLSFEFKLDEDSLTLIPFDYGDLTVSWKQPEEAMNLRMHYRERGSTNWEKVVIPSDINSLVIEDLNENLIWEYQILPAKDQPAFMAKNTKTNYFNTFCYSIFESNIGEGKTEAGVIHWGIPLNKTLEVLEVYPDASFIVKYNTKIGEKQNKSDSTVAKWIEIKDVSINRVSWKLDSLVGGEKYVYKVGLDLGEEVVWSETGKFDADRAWGLFKTLFLIGALGLFIYGMKIMSEGLQQAAGSRLRNMLGKITSNRFKGIITGLGITSVVQSSSVTTVMVVSFVNAGLMSLKQSVGVIMGANIGTTITGWLVLIFGFKVDIGSYALVLIAFGAPLLFFSRSRTKSWANVIIGFSILFLGLAFLKEAVPSLSPDSALVQFFIDYKDSGFLGTLMFVGLGTLVTVVVQSSSAAMALTMTMVAGNLIPFEVATAMILGENIGTTITAQLAALIGNVHAKRAAMTHTIFNLFGVLWAVIAFNWFLDGIAGFMERDPYSDPDAANTGLVIFHSVFNIANVLLLVWLVPWFVRIVHRLVKSRGAADEEFKLDYIGTSMMGTPDLSLLEAKKEIAKFGKLTTRMNGFARNLLTEQNTKAKNKLREKIAKYEEITDRVEIEVANYLSRVSEGEMSEETAKRVRAMNSIVNDLERIGDVFYQISKEIERKDERKIYFMPEQRTSLMEMFVLVEKAFEVMVENLESEWNDVNIEIAVAAENEINTKRDEMRKEHLENLNKPDFNMQSGMVFNNLFSSLEKVGDHIINVSEAVVGKI